MPDLQLKRAIEIVGGPTAVGRALGVTRQTVHTWERCPPRYCARLSRLTGLEVTVTQLRPDIFPAWLFDDEGQAA